MNPLHSLKYKIAATIFVLELVLLSLVLWQTQSLSYTKSQQAIADQDLTILTLLSEVAHTALFTGEFADVQLYVEQAARSPHIELIYLSDFRDRVVASSRFEYMGKHLQSLEYVPQDQDPDNYWKRRTISNSDGALGQLHIRFSGAELREAYYDALTFGFSLALFGMFVVAAAGILFGQVLTRRLDRVIQGTVRFAEGDMNARCEVGGRDEVAKLGHALNQMVDQIHTNFEQIEHMAFHDSLTGLTNRRYLNRQLSDALLSAYEDNRTHCFMYMDLDQFKVVNDTSGHDAGDHLLIELSVLLRQTLDDKGSLSRLGGDEFGILIEDCHSDQATQTAERLLQAIRGYRFHWKNKTFDVGASIGVVPITQHSKDLKEVLSNADIACYTAKDKGRNSIHVASLDDMELSSRADQMQWVSRIANALERREFVIFQQHIVHAQDTHQAFASEYLLRLRTDDGELIPPEHFLPAAERYRMMPDIDRHTIELVLSYIQPESGQRQKDASTLAFINLSGASLSDPEFFAYIQERFSQSGVNPAQVCFEITETVAIDNFDNALMFIEQLRDLGCKIALDDFGSGMCSFTYLKSLPVDFVKIDGSFIINMKKNPMDHSIVVAINDISSQAGFQTIAEYVEDKDLLPVLQDIGIDYVQGHAIHEPEAVAREILKS